MSRAEQGGMGEDDTRRAERRRVGSEIAARLARVGVTLTGEESDEGLVSLLETVEQFERAVQRKGGDLMVDEPGVEGPFQPDDAHFVLPRRGDDEAVAQYLGRLRDAIDVVERHRRLGDGA